VFIADEDFSEEELTRCFNQLLLRRMQRLEHANDILVVLYTLRKL
jgi:hypothetical protein